MSASRGEEKSGLRRGGRTYSSGFLAWPRSILAEEQSQEGPGGSGVLGSGSATWVTSPPPGQSSAAPWAGAGLGGRGNRR